MWFDLLASGTPPQMIDCHQLCCQHCVGQLVESWKPKQQFRPAPSVPTIPNVLFAPIEDLGVHPYSGWVSPMLQVEEACQDCLQIKATGSYGKPHVDLIIH